MDGWMRWHESKSTGYFPVQSCPLSTCIWLQGGDHIQAGVRYTYKDCINEPVNKKCYGGACVECASNSDCSDGVQNCAETCLDGSAQCNAGTKETDNTYLVSFEFSQPADLSGTSLYSDANSWNCMDGLDNDHDCLIDCKDTDCSL